MRESYESSKIARALLALGNLYTPSEDSKKEEEEEEEKEYPSKKAKKLFEKELNLNEKFLKYVLELPVQTQQNSSHKESRELDEPKLENPEQFKKQCTQCIKSTDIQLNIQVDQEKAGLKETPKLVNAEIEIELKICIQEAIKKLNGEMIDGEINSSAKLNNEPYIDAMFAQVSDELGQLELQLNANPNNELEFKNRVIKIRTILTNIEFFESVYSALDQLMVHYEALELYDERIRDRQTSEHMPSSNNKTKELKIERFSEECSDVDIEGLSDEDNEIEDSSYVSKEESLSIHGLDNEILKLLNNIEDKDYGQEDMKLELEAENVKNMYEKNSEKYNKKVFNKIIKEFYLKLKYQMNQKLNDDKPNKSRFVDIIMKQKQKFFHLKSIFSAIQKEFNDYLEKICFENLKKIAGIKEMLEITEFPDVLNKMIDKEKNNLKNIIVDNFNDIEKEFKEIEPEFHNDIPIEFKDQKRKQFDLFEELYSLHNSILVEYKNSNEWPYCFLSPSGLLDTLFLNSEYKPNVLVLTLYPINIGYSTKITMELNEPPVENIYSYSENEKDSILFYVENEKLPPKLLKELDASAHNLFYNNSVIVEIHDRTTDENSLDRICRMLLRPSNETVLKDVEQLINDNSHLDWTYERKLELEREVLLSSKPNICLDSLPIAGSALALQHQLLSHRKIILNPIKKEQFKLDYKRFHAKVVESNDNESKSTDVLNFHTDIENLGNLTSDQLEEIKFELNMPVQSPDGTQEVPHETNLSPKVDHKINDICYSGTTTKLSEDSNKYLDMLQVNLRKVDHIVNLPKYSYIEPSPEDQSLRNLLSDPINEDQTADLKISPISNLIELPPLITVSPVMSNYLTIVPSTSVVMSTFETMPMDSINDKLRSITICETDEQLLNND